jgi:K+-sensing histidine kinase KdpD
VEIGLALAVGAAAFVLAGVPAPPRSHLPAVLFGVLLLAAVLAVTRVAGILYELPVGVVTILAFDWYFLPPLRALDAGTVLVLGLFLVMAVTVGAFATLAVRRPAGSEQARGVLAEEQAALRRAATLVARQPSPAEVFSAVTEEAGKLLHLDNAPLGVYEHDETATVVRPGACGARRSRSAGECRWKGTTSSSACPARNGRPVSTTTATPGVQSPGTPSPWGFAWRSGLRFWPGDGCGV